MVVNHLGMVYRSIILLVDPISMNIYWIVQVYEYHLDLAFIHAVNIRLGKRKDSFSLVTNSFTNDLLNTAGIVTYKNKSVLIGYPL
jgi:hypothetical protein